MRSQISRFSSSERNTQLATSMAVRPHPRQISSYKVEHTATHGESDTRRLFISSIRAARCSEDARLKPDSDVSG